MTTESKFWHDYRVATLAGVTVFAIAGVWAAFGGWPTIAHLFSLVWSAAVSCAVWIVAARIPLWLSTACAIVIGIIAYKAGARRARAYQYFTPYLKPEPESDDSQARVQIIAPPQPATPSAIAEAILSLFVASDVKLMFEPEMAKRLRMKKLEVGVHVDWLVEHGFLVRQRALAGGVPVWLTAAGRAWALRDKMKD